MACRVLLQWTGTEAVPVAIHDEGVTFGTEIENRNGPKAPYRILEVDGVSRDEMVRLLAQPVEESYPDPKDPLNPPLDRVLAEHFWRLDHTELPVSHRTRWSAAATRTERVFEIARTELGVMVKQTQAATDAINAGKTLKIRYTPPDLTR